MRQTGGLSQLFRKSSGTALFNDNHADNLIALERVRDATEDIGFMTLTDKTITTDSIERYGLGVMMLHNKKTRPNGRVSLFKL